MPMFVHLTAESLAARIRGNGISRLRRSNTSHPGGVFAVPLTRNFYISHQWLRELKRRGEGPIVGIYFRIPDLESVWIGHYGGLHQEVTAAVAAATFSESQDRQGWEVIIPRRIAAKEIHRVRSLPQVVGWRFSPDAKGKPPFCTCKFCTRGEYGAGRLRTRLGSPDG